MYSLCTAILRRTAVCSAVNASGAHVKVGLPSTFALFPKDCLVKKALCAKSTASQKSLHPPCTGLRGLHTSSQLCEKLISYNLADIGEGITECEIIQWFVKPGDKVAQFDKICEVASDKATVEITSRYDGTIKKIHYNDNDIALVGKPLVDIQLDNNEPDSGAPNLATETAPENSISSTDSDPTFPEPSIPHGITAPTDNPETDHSRDRTNDVVYATPAVRRVAREHSVDLKFVSGSGKGGRILKEDVYRHVKEKPASSKAPTTSSPVDSSKQHFVQANTSESSATARLSGASAVVTGEDRVVPLQPIQRVMFKSMTESLGIPHFRFKDEIELDALIKARQRINEHLNQASPNPDAAKLSYMPFFIKAASLALSKYPILNARVVSDDGGQPKLLYRAAHNIGVAMDTPGGLIVPNVKNVQTKSLIEIAEELRRLVEMGKSGSISGAALKGGTFTLSNVGMIGGTYLSPVLVSSEVCIGAIGKTQRLPRFETTLVDGKPVEQVVPKHILVTSWSADHRVVDGATMARFATLYKQLIEYPELMLANMK